MGTIKELKEKYQSENIADVEVFRNNELPQHVRGHGDPFHGDYMTYCTPEEYSDNEEVEAYEIMDEEEYANSVMTNCSLNTDFEEWYGDKNARVLIIKLYHKPQYEDQDEELEDKEDLSTGDEGVNADYKVFDFSKKKYPQILTSVSKSTISDRVYVYYHNIYNGKMVTCVFSTNDNSTSRLGTQINGNTAKPKEVLFYLGLATNTSVDEPISEDECITKFYTHPQ